MQRRKRIDNKEEAETEEETQRDERRAAVEVSLSREEMTQEPVLTEEMSSSQRGDEQMQLQSAANQLLTEEQESRVEQPEFQSRAATLQR